MARRCNPMNIRSNKQLLKSHALMHAYQKRHRLGEKTKCWPPTKIKAGHKRFVRLMKKRGLVHTSPLV